MPTPTLFLYKVKWSIEWLLFYVHPSFHTSFVARPPYMVIIREGLGETRVRVRAAAPARACACARAAAHGRRLSIPRHYRKPVHHWGEPTPTNHATTITSFAYGWYSIKPCHRRRGMSPIILLFTSWLSVQSTTWSCLIHTPPLAIYNYMARRFSRRRLVAKT